MRVEAGPVFVGVLWSSEEEAYRVVIQSVDSDTGEPRMLSFVPENGGIIGSTLLQYSGLVSLLNASDSNAMVDPKIFLQELLGEPLDTSYGDAPALLWTRMRMCAPEDNGSSSY